MFSFALLYSKFNGSFACNCPIHTVSAHCYWLSPAPPPLSARQIIALALLFRWFWSMGTAVLLLWRWAISTERPVSTVHGTINTEGACLKVRRSNENALIANIHLLNVRLWDHVINYTFTWSSHTLMVQANMRNLLAHVTIATENQNVNIHLTKVEYISLGLFLEVN